ncbi:beta-glucuronidase [Paenibacillus sp. LMG 31461]|uniref:Beta-glucuronidase n=1 Tax=Paenibacillus plantarum TaxID=2654975 RepID=A0ABX1X2R0_9BACL|nr:beta-glucuronidase [Paenibacillus plantarum]NOU62685.1 beta-glucuronidase [Paenibacillus plantarum]
MLYPQSNTKRELIELNGIWSFKLDDGTGVANRIYEQKLQGTIPMPVPASYNDLTEDARVRDHVGDVWYEREFYVSEAWRGKRIILRFGSVTHYGKVWINGQEVIEHHGGYTPFEADIAPFVFFDRKNRVIVLVNNVLDYTTVPIGEVNVRRDAAGNEIRKQDYFHDFFNYSGIHRPVRIYTTAQQYVKDITIRTDLRGQTGVVYYKVETEGSTNVKVTILDEQENVVAESSGLHADMEIEDPVLWEPGAAYLYTLKVEVISIDGSVVDTYNELFGIRTVKVEGKEFLINGKPFYFKGFGKHEDAEIHGKGLDEALNIKDFSLMKWIGANSFRTSHYPYSEEIMRLADREGIVVVDEVAAVGLHLSLGAYASSNKRNTWQTIQCQESHQLAIKELIKRDKNHACVVMWAIANEPAGEEEGAYEYFKPLADLTRKLDPTRPITIVNYFAASPTTCKIHSLSDVLCLNRYVGWYAFGNDLEMAGRVLHQELLAWWNLTAKPVFLTEFGADTIQGLTSTVPLMWSEEYQCDFLQTYHQVMDKLDFVVGEHVWNFADFATKQGIVRVDGNKKGVFTRDRRPKKAAHFLRERYRNIKDYYYKTEGN